MAKQVHDGHRQRMRERICKENILSLQPHEVLEYLLFSFIPRRDTNAIAHMLLDKFGSLSAVFKCSEAHLLEVPGMTENAAFFLSNLPYVFQLYLADCRRVSNGNEIKGRSVIKGYLGDMLCEVSEERVFVAAVDVHDKMIACELVAKGGSASVEVAVSQILSFAQRTKAYGVVIAHNHPAGNISPSGSDNIFTSQVIMGLEPFGYKLLDHYIFADGEVYSYEENGKLAGIEKQRKILKEAIWE